MKSLTVKKAFKNCILIVLVFTATLSVLNGQSQQKLYIRGQLKDQQSLQPVAFATVAIRRAADSTFISGTASNADGEFSIESVSGGSYCIIISAIGYNLVRK
jgi:hypothetical protein